MTTYNLQLAIGLDGVPQVVGGLKQVGAEVERTGGRTATATGRMRDEMNQTTGASGLLVRSLQGLTMTLGAGLAMLFAKFTTDIYSVNKEFGQLNAQLVTLTGSQRAADATFSRLEAFAKTTPYQLNEVVTAFAKLKARGLDPSSAALTSYGNTASGMSKSLDQMIEAVADATTYQFERLLEFGIKAETQGDKIIFTFNGVSTTVEKETSAIEGYLRRIGDVDFASGMTRQMEELGGAASNTGDSWAALMRTIGDIGATAAAKGGLSGLGTLLDTINADLRIGVRLLAEEKLMLQQFFDEVAIRMDSGENLNRWLTADGRAELQTELDASRQMYEYSWDKIQERWRGVRDDLNDFIGPPAPNSAAPKGPTAAELERAHKETLAIQKEMDLDAINARVETWVAGQEMEVAAINARVDAWVKGEALIAEVRTESAEQARSDLFDSLEIQRTMELDAINARVEAWVEGEEKKTKASAEAASALQEVFTAALTRIDGLFVNLWASGLSGFKDFADELKNTFRRLLAELIQMALRNRILLPLAVEMGIPGAAKALSAATGTAVSGAASGATGAAVTGTAGAAAGGAAAGAGTGAFAAMAPYAVPAAAAIAAALYTHKVWTDESWGGTNTGTKALATAFPMLGITNKVMGGGLFGTSWKTKAAGFELGIDDGAFAGQEYETQKKKKSLGRGSKSRTNYSALDAEWEEFLAGQYEAVLTAIDAGAAAFGDTASRQALASFSMAAEKIDLTGLNAEEQQAKIAEYFRSVSDAAITTLYPDIADYTRLGEDATATFARLSGSLAAVNSTAGLLHLTLLPAGLASGELASQLIDLMGGMDAFTSQTGFFFTNFYSAAEQGERQTAAASAEVARAFAELGQTIPATRADFAGLVEGLDLTSESGRATFSALMAIAPAFDLVAGAADQAREALKGQITAGLDVAGAAAQSLREILGGAQGGASPESLYADRVRAFDEARSSGRDAELPELGRLLLEASQSYNASGSAFQADLAAVTQALGGLAGIDGAPTLSSTERQVQLLTDIRTAIDEENAAQLALLADQTGLMRELLRQYLTSQGERPSFAVGSSYIPADMTANIHQGEKILDAQSSAILSRYGIRVQSTGDSRETVAELKESKAELKEQTRQLTATVRVLQAGLQRLIGLAEQQAGSSKELVGKARLAASA